MFQFLHKKYYRAQTFVRRMRAPSLLVPKSCRVLVMFIICYLGKHRTVISLTCILIRRQSDSHLPSISSVNECIEINIYSENRFIEDGRNRLKVGKLNDHTFDLVCERQHFDAHSAKPKLKNRICTTE